MRRSSASRNSAAHAVSPGGSGGTAKGSTMVRQSSRALLVALLGPALLGLLVFRAIPDRDRGHLELLHDGARQRLSSGSETTVADQRSRVLEVAWGDPLVQPPRQPDTDRDFPRARPSLCAQVPGRERIPVVLPDPDRRVGAGGRDRVARHVEPGRAGQRPLGPRGRRAAAMANLEQPRPLFDYRHRHLEGGVLLDDFHRRRAAEHFP